MDRLDNLSIKRYIKHNVTKEWLQKNNFHYSYTEVSSKGISDEDVYTHRFIVYKNDFSVKLECEITLYELTGDIILNVFDYGTRDKYAPFYYYEYGINTMLEAVNQRILAELKQLDIIEANTNFREQKV